MKRLFWFASILVICTIEGFAQAVPGTYPYAVPLGTSGGTPALTYKVTGPVNPTGYASAFPSTWDVLTGGGYRVVSNNTERNAINVNWRKEGMWVNSIASARVYQLQPDLTSWADLGDPTAWASSGGNFATADLVFTGDRIHDGDAFSLTLQNTPTIIFNGNSISFQGAGINAVDINSTGVTLDIDDSGLLFLKTPAVNNITAVADQFLKLINATTGQSEWADVAAAAPSPANVIWVDTAADMVGETQDMVITKGYTTVGDGGGGTYRRESASVATINNVTVFSCTAGGRYILQHQGIITAKQAGCAGNNTTDDNARLQALFNASVGSIASLESLTYKSTGALTVPAGVKVSAGDATINIATTAVNYGINMGSSSLWFGGTVVLNASSVGSYGQATAFGIGDYGTSPIRTNITVRNCTISVLNVLGTGILVTGDADRITLENLTFSASATLDAAITIHWGFVVDGVQASGTKHPRNVTVRNITVGDLTTTSGDGAAIVVSSAYNVLVENVYCSRARYGIIVSPGDYGYAYSGLNISISGGVTMRNVTIARARNAGIWCVGVDSFPVVRPMDYVFDGCVINGFSDAGGQSGIFLTSARNATFRSCVVNGFETGVTFSSAKNILFDSCTFTTNRLGAIVGDNAGSSEITVSRSKFSGNAAGLSGSGAAAIILTAGNNFLIDNCRFGLIGGEPHQEVGVYSSAAATGVTLMNNKVTVVKAAGANIGYVLSDSTNAAHLNLVSGNTVASGITVYSGPSHIPIARSGATAIYVTPTQTSFILP